VSCAQRLLEPTQILVIVEKQVNYVTGARVCWLRFCVICRDPEEPNSKGDFSIQDILLSHQLVIFSIASKAVLTHPTALALVAHVLSSRRSPPRAPEASPKAWSLGNTLHFLHLFGMPFIILACMHAS